MHHDPFDLTFTGYYPETLRVLWFRGREATNELYRFDLCVACNSRGC